MTRPKSVALAFLFGALLIGGLLGFTADRLVLRERLCERAWDQRRMSARLADDLALAGSQQAAVDGILSRRHDRWRAAIAPVQPQIDAVMDDARDEIRALLTPEQRAMFEKKVQESDARSRR